MKLSTKAKTKLAQQTLIIYPGGGKGKQRDIFVKEEKLGFVWLKIEQVFSSSTKTNPNISNAQSKMLYLMDRFVFIG